MVVAQPMACARAFYEATQPRGKVTKQRVYEHYCDRFRFGRTSGEDRGLSLFTGMDAVEQGLSPISAAAQAGGRPVATRPAWDRNHSTASMPVNGCCPGAAAAALRWGCVCNSVRTLHVLAIDCFFQVKR